MYKTHPKLNNLNEHLKMKRQVNKGKVTIILSPNYAG